MYKLMEENIQRVWERNWRKKKKISYEINFPV